jgi:hypothetical protein
LNWQRQKPPKPFKSTPWISMEKNFQIDESYLC